jgi:membrane protease YdiL (CAAX protease family)
VVLIIYRIFGFGIFQHTSWHIRLNLPFPADFIVGPIVEVILLAMTLLLARYKGAGLKDLGLKRSSLKTLASNLIALIPLFLVTVIVTGLLTIVFGPDPMAETYTKAAIPGDVIELITYIVISLVIVGPVEELAYRGFVQQGFENSFGKVKGLFIASFFFGIPHFANYPYNAATAFACGLVLGYVWQKTGQNTTSTAVIHGVFNSIGVILVYFGVI